MRFGR